MSLILKCPTEYAVLLVGQPQGEKPMRFPLGDEITPSLVVKANTSISINEQLIEAAAKALNLSITGQQLEIEQKFHNPLNTAIGDKATLYLGTLSADVAIDTKDWVTMPELLRMLPKDRNRLSYVKAWQVLTGALSESTKAVDILDVLDPKLLQ